MVLGTHQQFRSSAPSIMRSIHSSRCIFLLCIVLFVGKVCGSLDYDEKVALEELFSSFPNLASIPTSEFIEDGKIDYGRSWTNNFDNLCLGSDGYEYYGLYCSNGHISGIVLYVPFQWYLYS